MTKPRLGELFVSAQVITPAQLEEALAVVRPPGKKLGQLLIELGLVSEAQLTQTLSLQLGIPWVSLVHIDFSRQLLARVPQAVAERHCLIPIFVRHVKGQGDTLYVAIEDPKNANALDEVGRVASLPTRPMIASPADIRNAIRLYYGDDTFSEPPMTRPEPPPVPMRKPPIPGASAPRTGSPSEERIPVAPPVPQAPPPAPAVAVEPQATTMEERIGPSSDTPSTDPQLEVRMVTLPPQKDGASGPRAGKRRGRVIALTLLDGTKVNLPSREVEPERGRAIPPSEGGFAETLTGRDFVAALRASAHGADASEILGATPQWEAVMAALLSVLMKKGLVTEWEFLEEYKKI